MFFKQFAIGKEKLNDKIHIMRRHFGPSHHPQNSKNSPNYREIRQFSLTVRTDEKKEDFFLKIYQKSNIGILAYADISILKK